MQEVILVRRCQDSKVTTGVMIVFNGKGIRGIFATIELPWKGNERNVSCIPVGSYKCRKTWSPKSAKFRYEIMNVEGRSGIRFDIANFVSELRGCIGLGLEHRDINGDGVVDVVMSKVAMGRFESVLRGKEFKLIIM